MFQIALVGLHAIGAVTFFCECRVISAEDAVEAVKHGAAGVIVSNHGGRQLDSVPAAVGLYASRESQ